VSKPSEILPESLVWLDDGHASDLALSTMVDGQDELLEASVVAHVTACEACAERFAVVASEGFDAEDAIQYAAHVSEVRERGTLPAVVLGFSALFAAAVWRFASNAGDVAYTVRTAPKWMPAMHKHAHGAFDFALAWYQTRSGLAASFVAASVLVAAGVLIARAQIRAAKLNASVNVGKVREVVS